MSQFAVPFALLCGLTLASLGAGLSGFFWMQRTVRAAAGRAGARHAENEAAIQAVRNETESCARQLREIRQEPPRSGAFAHAQAGLNMSKRSQALRMSRRGDTPEQIASTLGVPLQEVELLLKVHRIVLAAV